MSKITYSNKQTAVDPNNPAPNEIFYATDANEVKASVNALYDRLDNITLVDGFVSGPNLVATDSTHVAIQTYTQNVALIYNANNFQYTRNAGASDLSFAATPNGTYDKGCIIQANGTTISLKQGTAAANVIYPTPDTGYVQLYSFIISTTGISSIISSLADYVQLNNANSGNVVIDGYYKQSSIVSKVLKTDTNGTIVGIDGTSSQYIKGDGSLGTLPSGGSVSSVGLSMPSAFSVANSPITSSGTLAVTGAGNTTQYIAGDGSLITFPIAGQSGSLVREVRNVSGATMTKGTVVYINGANGNKPTIAKAQANAESTSARTFGFVQADIANNANGYVVVIGDITGLDTSANSEGTQLYLSGTTAGAYTSTKTLAPTHLVYVGKVTRSHPTLGQIEVGIQNGYELDEIHDCSIVSVANNQGLFWDSATSLWKNKTIATILGYTPIGGSGTSNYIAKFNGGTTTLGNSTIFDDGTYVRIGTGGFGKFNVTQVGTSLEINTSSNNIEMLAYNRGLGSYKTFSLRGSEFIFSPSDVEKMRIDSNGNVGIGYSGPIYKLDVNGTIRGEYNSIYGNAGINASLSFIDANLNTHSFVFESGLLTSYDSY